MSRPSSSTVPNVGSTSPAATEQSVDLPAPLAPSNATTVPRVELQGDAVEHLGVAVAGDDAVHREHRIGAPVPGSRSVRRGGVLGGRMDDLVFGHDAVVGCRFGRGDARRALLGPLLAEPLLADEREDAVGLLRQLDGAEARQDRHEVDRRRPSAAAVPPPSRSELAIQWKTAGPAANAKPASSAPPGRRMPNVTASASQNSPM